MSLKEQLVGSVEMAKRAKKPVAPVARPAPKVRAPVPMTIGIHEDVPLADYLGWDCWSRSAIMAGQESMAHAHAAKNDELERKITDDMVLGSALHTAFLEPELAATKIAVWTGAARRGGEWEDFKAANAGRSLLTGGQHEKLIGMVRSLRRHPEVRRWLAKIESTEVSAVGLLDGLMVKGRTDALTADPLIDLKKVVSGNKRTIGRTVYDFGYHIQAAVYTRLFKRSRFILMTVEDSPPYDVAPYELSPAFIGRGWDEARKVIDGIKECEATGLWPGRCSSIETLDEPEWLAPRVTIS